MMNIMDHLWTCHHDMCMREARAREFASGIGKGGGICSRHGATVEVVRKNCIHEDCTGIAFKGDYCKSHSKVMKSGNRRKTQNRRVSCKENLISLLPRTYTILIISSRRIEIKPTHGTLNVECEASRTKKMKLVELSFVRTRSSQASKRRSLISSMQ